ncbi:uncharacterized protein TNCV_2663121 [Trichonephila clavipes]|nr:uncharacterized protein TNCV_2663121 [Trichonephila clavipes]
MTAQRYVLDILHPHVLPLMQRLPGAIFQHDNARPHTTKVSQDCLRTVTTLPLPADPQICLQSSISEIIRDDELILRRESVSNNSKAVDCRVVRASDSRPEGLGSMPDATKYPPSTHGVCAR